VYAREREREREREYEHTSAEFEHTLASGSMKNVLVHDTARGTGTLLNNNSCYIDATSTTPFIDPTTRSAVGSSAGW
jgi:hypothetical protein